jgi:2-dehydro-3-deoxyglucarate aldolase/4-hydroxy-2-oxoheptanedioate aldolase
VATYNRACRFGLDPAALARADDEILGVVQVESAAAVAQAEQIAAIDGVDVLFVGPRDLSHDLDVPGDTGAPAYLEALATVRAAADRHGKACGLLTSDGATAHRLRGQGWRFVAVGSDTTLPAAALGTALAAARTDDIQGGDR